MSFHDIQFPTNISYGSTGGPGFNTAVIELDSGAEQRISRWSVPRRQYNASYGVKTLTDMSNLIDFYIGRDGIAHSFRYKDFLDFTSATNHRDAHVFTDENIGTGDGTTTTYQLRKSYASGSSVKYRKIAKPVSGQVLIGINGVNQASGWTVNTSTGIVTFTTAPTSSYAVTAGFQFDVHSRFGSEVDEALLLSYDAVDMGSVPGSIPIIETHEDEGSHDETFYYGGSSYIAWTGVRELLPSEGRVLSLAPGTSSQKLILPPAPDLAPGGPHFYLINTTSYAISLRDSQGSIVATLGSGGKMTLLIGQQDGINEWVAF